MRETHSSTQNASACRIDSALKRGIDPRWSGFRVQGSATSPAGMALFHNLLSYYNRIAPFLQGFFKTFCKREAGAFGKAAMPRAPENVSAKKNKYRGGKPRRNGYLGKTPYNRADMRCRKAATAAPTVRGHPQCSHKPGRGRRPRRPAGQLAMFAQTKRLPCVKGAGATAPEGL